MSTTYWAVYFPSEGAPWVRHWIEGHGRKGMRNWCHATSDKSKRERFTLSTARRLAKGHGNSARVVRVTRFTATETGARGEVRAIERVLALRYVEREPVSRMLDDARRRAGAGT